MSELKEIELGEAYKVFDDDKEFYLKSEADVVIAEKDEVINELEMKVARAQLVLRLNKPEALFSDLEIMGRLRHEIDVVARRERHQKYKRCLAMAEWCKESLRLMRTYEVTDDYWNLEPEHDAEYFCKKGDFFSKWRKRWLELAEKFKEAK